MSKHIMPRELAEIVTGLLIDPSFLGELDSPAVHQDFMLEIGKIVADFCGGEIRGIFPPDSSSSYLSTEEDSPSLIVSPNNNLPHYHRNIWSAYDPEGWNTLRTSEDCTHLLEPVIAPMDKQAITQQRRHLQQLLREHVTHPHPLPTSQNTPS